MIRTLTVTAAALAFAGTAFANTQFTATLETPMEEQESIIAEKALWDCEGATCSAELKRKSVRVSTCKKVVKEVGRLTAFSNETDTLSAEDLERCNEVAKS